MNIYPHLEYFAVYKRSTRNTKQPGVSHKQVV